MRFQKRWIIVLLGTLLWALAGIASAAKLTISLRYANQADREYWDQLVREFNELYPHIELEVYNFDYDTAKLTTMMLAGEGPDVTEMFGHFAASWCDSGLLLDLRPFVERDMSAEDIADFFPGQWAMSFVSVGPMAGVQCGIPRYTNVQMQNYHVAKFAEAGLVPPSELARRGEWTWDALLEAAQKLTRRSGDVVTQWGYKPRVADGRWYTRVMGAGGTVFDPADPSRFTLGEPAAIQGLEFLQSLIHVYEVAPPEQWGPDFDTGLFGIGDHWGTCCIADLRELVAGNFEWETVPLAAGPAGPTPLVWNDMFGIWSGTKYPEETWAFVKFATSPRGMELLAKYRHQMPARRSALHHYVEVIGETIDIDFIAASANTARGEPYPVSADWQQLFQIIEPAVVGQIVYGNRPASVVVEEIRPQVEAVIKK